MADVVTDDTAAEEADEAPAPPRRWLDFAVPLALFAGTIATRLPHLKRPNAYVFDEIYYASDSVDIVRRGLERGGVVHPPVGKWLIAIGVRIFGYNPTGYRFAALVCGALVVVLVYLAARQVVPNRVVPAFAGVLAALDGVGYTTGRVAMLDVFVALFTMIAVWCTLAALRHANDARLVRRYKWGTAIALGFGLATKWTLGYILLVSIIGFLVVHIRAPAGDRQGRAVLGTLLTLTIVPVLIYVACYVPWMVHVERTGAGYVECVDRDHCSFSLWDRLVMFKDDQQRVLKFHTGLLSENNSNADFAWRWINQARPAVLFRKTCVEELQQAPPELSDHACDGAEPNDVMEIVTVANPVVWYFGLAGGVVLLVRVIRGRNIPALFLLLFVFYQWFPWLIDPFAIKDAVLHRDFHDVLQQRRAYSFYLSSIIPVVAIWPAVALDYRKVRWLRGVVAAAAIVAFVYYLPIWSGHPMDPDQIKAREYWSAR